MEDSEAKVKGLQVLDLVKLMKKNRDHALQLLPSDLHHYLEATTILVSSWYPDSDVDQLLLAAGEIVRSMVPGEDPWTVIGEAGAQRDLSGPYASLVRNKDPATALTFSAQAWRLYRNSGKIVVTVLDAGNARIELHDFHRLRPEIALVNAAYFRSLLRFAGAVEPQVTPQPYIDTSDTVTVWQATWR